MTASRADERRVAAYWYDLPDDLIARVPAQRRDAARLLVLAEGEGVIDAVFSDFPQLLRPDDLLVINETRVIPARLRGTRDGGGRAEILLLRPSDRAAFDYAARDWDALVRPAKHLGVGARIDFGPSAVQVVGVLPDGPRVVRFPPDVDVEALLERCGEVPLPPYVGAGDAARDARYQTVFARVPGSVAAPTASLHFTSGVLDAIVARGVEVVPLVLDVGIGTFRPMRGESIDDHVMHAESYTIPAATAAAVGCAKQAGRRVVAAGTTVLRALESAALAGGGVGAGSAATELFISPGFQFRVADALLTNFHLPRSTLLVLVAAFGGYERVRLAYRYAIAQRYRFFSFGDAMFIERTDAAIEQSDATDDRGSTDRSRAPREVGLRERAVTDDDVLDLARLVEAYDNDAASIANLLMLARQTERRHIRALRAAIDAADLVAIASVAHSIKGSASNIGAGKVSRVAARIEDSARSGTWDGIAEAAAELDGDYAELCRRISDYAGTIA